MSIGENIRNARKALNMSQEQLATAIDANRVTISKYENGGYLPSVPALEKLAEALKTTPAALSGTASQDDSDSKVPQTIEARILSEGVDRMPKEQREQALQVFRAVFTQYADYFDERKG